MITHLSTRADGARKKFKDHNEQVGEHVDAVAQSYAPIFVFQCLLHVCLLYLYVTTLTTITSFHFTTSVWHVISFSHSSSFVFTLPLSFPNFIIAVSWLPQFTTFTWLRLLHVMNDPPLFLFSLFHPLHFPFPWPLSDLYQYQYAFPFFPYVPGPSIWLLLQVIPILSLWLVRTHCMSHSYI